MTTINIFSPETIVISFEDESVFLDDEEDDEEEFLDELFKEAEAYIRINKLLKR